MSALVVAEAGCSLSFSAARIVVKREGKVLRRVPLAHVDRVLILARANLAGALVHRLMRKGCPTIFFDSFGRYVGQLVGPENRHAAVRLAQLRALDATESRLRLARWIVEAKIANQRTLVMRFQRRHGVKELAVLTERLRVYRRDAESAASLDGLRGVEGAAARAFFEALSHMLLDPAFRFSGRNRRPPRDPVNACLSFGYAILFSTLQASLHKVGLDPSLGALHDVARGRASLALDLMEEWRPVVVDSVVLRLFNRRRFRPTDFCNPKAKDIEEAVLGAENPEEAAALVSNGPPPVYCGPLARKILVREIRRRMSERVLDPQSGRSIEIEDAIELRVLACRRYFLREEERYVPFRFE